MAIYSVYLLVAFLCALVALALRLPPLVGFLAAGFLLAGLGVPEAPGLSGAADLGVTLLLFGIGLKLDARLLLRREVWLTATLHMAAFTVIGAGLIAAILTVAPVVQGSHWREPLVVGLALSFSSTVLVVKMLEDRGETQALYGRIAIGILVVQDLVAVVALALSKQQLPSPWILALVGLWPLVQLLRWLWSRMGHGEMQALFGIVVALLPGYALFDAVGLKGDLGALVMGVMLAGHPAAAELGRHLLTVKDLLLVCFFVSIGRTGLPAPEHLGLAALLLALLPLQAVAYSLLLRCFQLHRRTTSRAGLALANLSEFGLIVTAVATGVGWLAREWLTVMAVAVAGSFMLSAAVSRREALIDWYAARLPADPSPAALHPECRPIDLGEAQAVVLGMGRVGQGAATQLIETHGLRVVGIEQSRDKQRALDRPALPVIEADAGDHRLWESVAAHPGVFLIVLALPSHEANLLALARARTWAFEGVTAAASRYPDHVDALREAGVNVVLQVYAGAGAQLADEALEYHGR